MKEAPALWGSRSTVETAGLALLKVRRLAGIAVLSHQASLLADPSQPGPCPPWEPEASNPQVSTHPSPGNFAKEKLGRESKSLQAGTAILPATEVRLKALSSCKGVPSGITKKQQKKQQSWVPLTSSCTAPPGLMSGC